MIVRENNPGFRFFICHEKQLNARCMILEIRFLWRDPETSSYRKEIPEVMRRVLQEGITGGSAPAEIPGARNSKRAELRH